MVDYGSSPIRNLITYNQKDSHFHNDQKFLNKNLYSSLHLLPQSSHLVIKKSNQIKIMVHYS